MKKLLFYFSLIVSVILLFNILQILFYDLERLTNYGYGYLAGKIILFLIFVSISFFLRKPKQTK